MAGNQNDVDVGEDVQQPETKPTDGSFSANNPSEQNTDQEDGDSTFEQIRRRVAREHKEMTDLSNKLQIMQLAIESTSEAYKIASRRLIRITKTASICRQGGRPRPGLEREVDEILPNKLSDLQDQYMKQLERFRFLFSKITSMRENNILLLTSLLKEPRLDSSGKPGMEEVHREVIRTWSAGPLPSSRI
jgi:chromosome segregation ATPase